MKKRLSLILACILAVTALSGCVSREAQKAMDAAEEYMEDGDYEKAEKQFKKAIRKGIKDKKFKHESDVVEAYNDAMDLFTAGKFDEALDKLDGISRYSSLPIADDIDELIEKVKSSKSSNDSSTGNAPAGPEEKEKINKKLSDAKKAYDSKSYEKAKDILDELDESKMTENQKKNYHTLKINTDNKLEEQKASQQQASQPQSAPVQQAPRVDYSSYDGSLYTAHIANAESGAVYLWQSNTGQDYYTTISNGTNLYSTGATSNGRTLCKYNGQYGWITSRYLYSGSASTRSYQHYPKAYTEGNYISGAEEGCVYFWKASTGDSYYCTVPNGASISPTGNYANGRTQAYYGGTLGWFTSRYVN